MLSDTRMSKPTSLQEELDARGDVYRIADRRIIEAALGAHIADACEPRMYADADADLSFTEAEGVIGIEACERLTHAQGGSNRLARMIGDVDWRIPEGHDRVADELVERALVCRDVAAQRVKQRVQKADEGGWRQSFADRGEASHVHEHHRQLAIVAAEAAAHRASSRCGAAAMATDTGRRHDGSRGAAGR